MRQNKTIAIRYGNYADKEDLIEDALFSLGVYHYRIDKSNKGAPEILVLDPSTGHVVSKIWMSITHSYSLFGLSKTAKVAIAISTFCPIGIDMERQTRKIGIKPARILSKKELKVYNSCIGIDDETTLNSLMIMFWTMKEAMLKAKGTGINTSLSGCCSIEEIRSGKMTMFRKDDFVVSIYIGEYSQS